MRARNIILTIAAAVLLAAPTAVFAQNGSGPGDGTESGGAWGGGQGHHGGGQQGRFGNPEGGDGLRFFERMLPRMAEELGLSDEQLSEIQAIVDAARATIEKEGYIEQLRVERDAYRASNDNPRIFNEPAFLAHAAAMHEIQTAISVIVGQAKADVFNVLTDEQIEQLEDMRGKFGSGKARRGSGRRSSS